MIHSKVQEPTFNHPWPVTWAGGELSSWPTGMVRSGDGAGKVLNARAPYSIIGQGLTVLVEGAGGGCLDIVSIIYHFYLFLPLFGMAHYGLKYCLKKP